MKNIKQFFTYVVVGALVMALSISCKSNEEPTDNTHSNHPPSGTYSGTVIIGGNTVTTTATVTTSGGTCNISGIAYGNNTSDSKPYNITITKWSAGGSWAGRVFIFPENPDIATTEAEATIYIPEGTRSFDVRLYSDNDISLSFELYGIEYATAIMTRQQ